MKRRQKFAIIFILLISIVLRFYRLGDVPTGFHRDEAFLGYNAYSILKTGLDMTGHFLPLHFESFIYSPGGYSYISIPFIILFGLSTFSVRFASAFFGSLTILLTYFLVKELMKGPSFTKTLAGKRETLLPLLSALFLATAPWHINLSRTATENTLVVFFITAGFYLFLLYLRTNKVLHIFLSFFSFFITLGIYQAPRAFLPLFIPILLALFWKKLFIKQRIISTILYLIAIGLPLLLILMSPQLSLRLRTVNIFYAEETKLVIEEQIREDGTLKMPIFTARFFHNKPAGYFKEMIGNYFKHFSFPFLFEDAGLPPRYRIYKAGLLYLFEFPLILIGLYLLVRRHNSFDLLIISWLFLAPVGSALTFDDIPNLQRTLIVFPALSIITANGLLFFITKLRKSARLFVIPALCIGSFFASYEILYYLHEYYIQQQVHRPWYRHEGYKELVDSVNAILNKYDKTVITNSESAPTIFFLFFGKYDPASFQKETMHSSFRSFDRIDFAKYVFTVEECPYKEFEEIDKQTGVKTIVHTAKSGILYVNYGTCKDIIQTGNTLKIISRGDNTPVFKIVELK